MALVSLPGSAPEKSNFAAQDDAVAERINKKMGTRILLVYAQHKGFLTSCFGETEYFATDIKAIQP